MPATPIKPKTDGPIQLQWNGGSVVVTPEDESRFVKESQWAVSACRNQLFFERFVERFKSEFLTSVHSWCIQHADRVTAAYVVTSASHMQVFVVTKAARYDFSLSDALADLEMDLFTKSWPCEVIQLPDGSGESLRTFFDPERSIEVYGDSSGTPGEGGKPQSVPE